MQNVINRLGWVMAGIVSLLVLAAITGIVHGGPLDPLGTPGPTAGALRPGTPITSLPITISLPGNYYLTGNLTMATTGAGINVNADDVTIDMGGFTIDGGGVGTYGIYSLSHQSLAVRNGNADHWTAVGFFVNYAALENVGASGDGIGIDVSSGTLTGCTVIGNTTTGVSTNGSTISNCNAVSNGTGFELNTSSLRDSTAMSNDTGIETEAGSNVQDCTLSENTGDGIVIGGAAANIHHNTISYSGANGIRDNGVATLIEDNTIYENGLSLFASGIYVHGNDSRVSRNSVSGTNGEGIAVDSKFNTIDQNSTFENSDIGVKVLGAKNTVINNSSTGNGLGTNYSIDVANNAGPIVAANAATNPFSNTQ